MSAIFCPDSVNEINPASLTVIWPFSLRFFMATLMLDYIVFIPGLHFYPRNYLPHKSWQYIIIWHYGLLYAKRTESLHYHTAGYFAGGGCYYHRMQWGPACSPQSHHPTGLYPRYTVWFSHNGLSAPYFYNNRMRGFSTKKKIRFVYQILLRTTNLYQTLLPSSSNAARRSEISIS